MNINMMDKKHKLTVPIPVKRVLSNLGRNIKDARRRRRISTQMMAERALISRTTLHKIEKGDPSVAMESYATVLFVLGLLERINEVADLKNDNVGRMLEDELLPKRIRRSKKYYERRSAKAKLLVNGDL